MRITNWTFMNVFGKPVETDRKATTTEQTTNPCPELRLRGNSLFTVCYDRILA